MLSTSASQIANLVESTAIELGEENYPSRATVYRLLEVEKEKREKKRNSRAIIATKCGNVTIPRHTSRR